jgi:hypothetical protein
MSRWSSFLPAVVPLFALAACVETTEEVDLGDTQQAVSPCPKTHP